MARSAYVASPGAHVLVIDDDSAVRTVVRAALEKIGCVITEAESGEAGLAAFAQERPDAVVLDCCCGSGTTGVAAVKLGRSFIGIDKEQHWIDRTRARIAEVQRQPALFIDEG